MSGPKYYTQFIRKDEEPGKNEYCGVVELNQPIENDSNEKDVEAILAYNFNLDQSQVKLISWSRLH